MDKNKLQVLRGIGYRITPNCGMCTHGNFDENRSGVGVWGTCKIWTYAHLKHGTVRQLSIHRAGSCEKFALDEFESLQLEAFKEFLK